MVRSLLRLDSLVARTAPPRRDRQEALLTGYTQHEEASHLPLDMKGSERVRRVE